MYWSRVKTILIILFFVIDISLLAYIVATREKPAVISETTITDVVNILNKNNISISPSVIPRNVENMGVIEMDNIWVDNEALAKLLMKSDTITSKQDNIYTSAAKSVEFQNNRFIYNNTEPNDHISPDSVIADTSVLLSEMSINSSRETADLSENTLNFIQTIDGKPIFETALTSIINSNGIISASGYWIISNKQNNIVKKQTSALLPATGILVDFVGNPYYNHSGDSIISITNGYTLGNIYRDTIHKLVSIIPAYKIIMSSGDYFIYDANTGEFLYGIKNEQIVLPK